MAATAGRNGEIKLQLPTSELGDTFAAAVVLGQVRSWSIDDAVETLDTTVMNGAATGFIFRDNIPSFKTWTMNVTFIYDVADAAQGAEQFKAGNDTIVKLYPAGDEAEDWTGTGLITTISRSASYDGLIECSMTIEGRSELAYTTA
jgi:hypothetical protein